MQKPAPVDANQAMLVQRPATVQLQPTARRAAFARALDNATSEGRVVPKNATSGANSKGSEHGLGDERWHQLEQQSVAVEDPSASASFHTAFVYVTRQGEDGSSPGDQQSDDEEQPSDEYAIEPVDAPPATRGDSIDDDTPDSEDGEGSDGPSEEQIEAFDRAMSRLRVEAGSQAGDREQQQQEAAQQSAAASAATVERSNDVNNEAVTAAGEAAATRWRTGDATQRYDFVGENSPVQTVELVRAPDGTYVANVDIIDMPQAGMVAVLERLKQRLQKAGVAVVRLFMGGRVVAESHEQFRDSREEHRS